MRFNISSYDIVTTQYDWGIPITFEVSSEQGFHIGDKIIIVFDSDIIETREYVVNKELFSFDLALSKSEADELFEKPVAAPKIISYSIKRFRPDNFLESLENARGSTVFKLIVKETVRYESQT